MLSERAKKMAIKFQSTTAEKSDPTSHGTSCRDYLSRKPIRKETVRFFSPLVPSYIFHGQRSVSSRISHCLIILICDTSRTGFSLFVLPNMSRRSGSSCNEYSPSSPIINESFASSTKSRQSKNPWFACFVVKFIVDVGE